MWGMFFFHVSCHTLQTEHSKVSDSYPSHTPSPVSFHLPPTTLHPPPISLLSAYLCIPASITLPPPSSLALRCLPMSRLASAAEAVAQQEGNLTPFPFLFGWLELPAKKKNCCKQFCSRISQISFYIHWIGLFSQSPMIPNTLL